MRFLAWIGAAFGDERSRSWEKSVASKKDAKRDLRGSYGFGRRSHCPDPNGKYSFGEDPTGRMHNPAER